MKRKRVVTSGVILSAILIAFLFLPLPVSRVRETGVIQVSEGSREYVHVYDTGMLLEVFVHDGQEVKTGTDLARFRNAEFEFNRQKFEKERDAAADLIQAIRQRIAEPGGDPTSRSKLEQELRQAQGDLRTNNGMLEKQEELIKRIEVLKAPRDGVVMASPKKEEIFKTWEKTDPQPFCTIGDPRKLRVLIPAGATDYREMRQNLERITAERPNDAYLEVSILAKHHREYKGRITKLPDTDDKNIPLPLTHRGGGTVATKPGGDPNVNQPLVQIYLVSVEMDDPDDTLTSGTLAVVKVHLRWRSAAWWAWRSIASALDIGLW